MAIFRFFRMAAAAILDFWNLKFLTVGTVKRVDLRQRAKFCQNRSNCGRDMAISQFFQDGGRPPSLICNARVGITHEGHLVVFVTVQNLVGIDAVVLIICTFFDFAILAWKRLFTPQNCFFWPLNGEQCEKSPKNGTSLRESASFEPSYTVRENPSRQLTDSSRSTGHSLLLWRRYADQHVNNVKTEWVFLRVDWKFWNGNACPKLHAWKMPIRPILGFWVSKVPKMGDS